MTEYRHYEEYCVTKILGICVNHAYQEVLENDFHFSDKLDIKRANDIGFELKVRKRPDGS